MSKIVLATINAKFIHAAVGLRYLYANLGELQEDSVIQEFEISNLAIDIVEKILLETPKIIGFGVYIWNVQRTREVVSILKRVAPEIVIVLGGPEVSYETADQPIVKLADFVVTGEADLTFAALCSKILNNQPPTEKIVRSPLPDLAAVKFPYEFYSDDDIRNRMLYVEASRGCPFSCEFCLSSIDIPVRQFPLEALMEQLSTLHKRGARTFKFVDRTFNLNIKIARTLLTFFLERMEPGLFVHFEMVPDRFPEQLREAVALFPKGALQLEIGIQSFNPEVGKRISRRQDFVKVEENLRFLLGETQAYLHVDLIAGLPGEDIASFAAGFDRLLGLAPQEIQLGILKRLKGTPIGRHDIEWEMQYTEDPPYEIISSKVLSFDQLQHLRRFSRFWDLIWNSGNFDLSKSLFFDGMPSAFEAFSEWTSWLFARVGRRSHIQLRKLMEYVLEYLCEVRGLEKEYVASRLRADYVRLRRNDLPEALQVPRSDLPSREMNSDQPLRLKRQARVAFG